MVSRGNVSVLNGKCRFLHRFTLIFFLHSVYTITCSRLKFEKKIRVILLYWAIKYIPKNLRLNNWNLRMHEKVEKIGFKNPICILESMFRPYPRKVKEFQTLRYQHSTPNMEVSRFLIQKEQTNLKKIETSCGITIWSLDVVETCL